MSFYFHGSINYDCGGSHDIIAHDFCNILDFRELHIEIVLIDYFRDNLIGCLAFGAARPQYFYFFYARFCRSCIVSATTRGCRFLQLFYNQGVTTRTRARLRR